MYLSIEKTSSSNLIKKNEMFCSQGKPFMGLLFYLPLKGFWSDLPQKFKFFPNISFGEVSLPLDLLRVSYSLPQKKVYTFVELSTQNWGGPDER